MKPVNKYLKEEDYRLVSYACLRKEFEDLYAKELRKTPSVYGSKYKNQTKIHWSRDWEYPWAIINSYVKKGHKVLDCGCGGSPLLLFLAQYGCEAYGIDPGLYSQRQSVVSYYSQLLKRVITQTFSKNRERALNIKESSDLFPDRSQSFLKHTVTQLKPPSDSWVYDAKRIKKLGLEIKYSEESLDKMHFETEFFDRVFCISVIEHLSEEAAYAGMKEMARVLKKGGLLVVTIDVDGPHLNPKLAGKYKELIDCSSLKLYGDSDFSIPNPSNVPGTYNVIGFILEK